MRFLYARVNLTNSSLFALIMVMEVVFICICIFLFEIYEATECKTARPCRKEAICFKRPT